MAFIEDGFGGETQTAHRGTTKKRGGRRKGGRKATRRATRRGGKRR